MTVEIVNYISDLDRTNPKPSDAISEGDDHVRNIKKAITETFSKIDGPVMVTQDELNLLQGVTDPISDSNLPEAASYLGSMLASTGNKWQETRTMKIVGDKVYIPGLAGLGNVNLYVNNEGEVLATTIANDPSLKHDLNFHTDVDFEGAPEEDDLLIHDGTAWRAKRFEGGNTMNPVQQPLTAGDFGDIVGTRRGMWGAHVDNGSFGLTFTVPDGLKFYCTEISTEGDYTGGGYYPVSVSYDTLWFDDVMMYAGWGVFGNSGIEQYGYMFKGSELGINDPVIQVKDRIALTASSNGAGGRLFIHGYFVEDK